MVMNRRNRFALIGLAALGTISVGTACRSTSTVLRAPSDIGPSEATPTISTFAEGTECSQIPGYTELHKQLNQIWSADPQPSDLAKVMERLELNVVSGGLTQTVYNARCLRIAAANLGPARTNEQLTNDLRAELEKLGMPPVISVSAVKPAGEPCVISSDTRPPTTDLEQVDGLSFTLEIAPSGNSVLPHLVAATYINNTSSTLSQLSIISLEWWAGDCWKPVGYLSDANRGTAACADRSDCEVYTYARAIPPGTGEEPRSALFWPLAPGAYRAGIGPVAADQMANSSNVITIVAG